MESAPKAVRYVNISYKPLNWVEIKLKASKSSVISIELSEKDGAFAK